MQQDQPIVGAIEPQRVLDELGRHFARAAQSQLRDGHAVVIGVGEDDDARSGLNLSAYLLSQSLVQNAESRLPALDFIARDLARFGQSV